MVAAGDDIHARRKKFARDLRSDSVATSGIFTIRYDKIQRVLIAQTRQNGFHSRAPGFAHDVADEEKFHEKNLTANAAKDTKRNYR